MASGWADAQALAARSGPETLGGEDICQGWMERMLFDTLASVRPGARAYGAASSNWVAPRQRASRVRRTRGVPRPHAPCAYSTWRRGWCHAEHFGQVILVDHEQSLGAELVADSLTDFVLGRMREERRDRRGDELPAVARVGTGCLGTIQAAAHPALEVLCIGAWDGTPFSLAPVAGLPRLRTLTALPGTLDDPLEVAGLTGLEFLELGVQEWRVLLDAGAVPRTLKAAAIKVRDPGPPARRGHRQRDPGPLGPAPDRTNAP
ncbi:hypothetical protein ACWD1Z_36905 [Streptomyces sp. NPDC002784]